MTAELSKTNKAKRLKGFEAVRGVLLEPTPFSVSAYPNANPLFTALNAAPLRSCAAHHNLLASAAACCPKLLSVNAKPSHSFVIRRRVQLCTATLWGLRLRRRHAVCERL